MRESKIYCDLCGKEFSDERVYKGFDMIDKIMEGDTILMKIIDEKYKDICKKCDKEINKNIKLFQEMFNEMARNVNLKIKEICNG
jgi:hypothetical protein